MDDDNRKGQLDGRPMGCSDRVSDAVFPRESVATVPALEQSITAAAIASPDGTLIYVNDAFLDLWGEECEIDVLGRNVASFHPDPEETARVVRAIQETGSWVGAMSAHRRDGSEFMVMVSASVVRTPSGEVQSIFAAFIDISGRVEGERALRDTQDRFFAALEHNRSFVWEIDTTGLYTYVSGGCELVAGYTAHELTGRFHYYDLHPEATREAFKEESLPLIRDGVPFHRYEQRFLHKNGTLYQLSSSGQPLFDEAGNVRGCRGISSDITGEHEIRERLRLSEALLADAERIAQTGSWKQDLRTGSVAWSTGVFRILGMDPDRDEPSVSAFFECVHPDDRPGLEAQFAEATAHGTEFQTPFRLRLGDGTIRHVESAAVFQYDESGKPVCVVGFLRDITQMVELQHDLRLRTDAMEKSITGMSIVTPDGTHVYVNDALVRLSGATTREQLLGTNVRAFHQDPAEVDEIRRHLQEIGSYSGEFVARRLDGAAVPVLFGANVLRGGAGERDYIVATFIDNTERKRAEAHARQQAERFSRMLEATPQGYWLVAPDSRLVDVNQSACTMLGYEREELLGLRVNDIDVLETPEETEQRIQRLLQRGHDRFETRHRRKDGSVIDVMVRVMLLDIADTQHLLAFVEDNSEHKRLARIELDREIALRSNRAKDAFLSSITHELRTPLNAVMGFAQLLQADDSLSDTHAGFVREIADAGKSLNALVDNILDFTRIESGMVELTPEVIDCGLLVLEAVQAVEAFARDRDIRLDCAPTELTGKDAILVRADRDRLRQVLLNLLTNGISYNTPGGSVEVTLHHTDATVLIAVSDTGVGIPRDKQGEIFSSVTRLGREALNIPGSGMGLMHSRRLMELMGGTITFESTENVGSTFQIELPREEAEKRP